ncbi:AarF/ABC1/UbiB kinase family protein [Candidatus Poribacteria bacterium]|nr:AarF/ABC1/UbiB kinase family protein [Candidatus Poribacteria bacterium]
MKIYELPGQIKNINRLRKIVTILVGHQSTSAISRLFKREKRPKEESRARLIREILEDLGTTYIKFGQWLSVRPDFVSPEVLRELEQLQDQLPPVRFKVIQRTIEQETRKLMEEIFSEFDPKPLSTASIAQVHRAVLKTGEEVAVKVQHPNLKRIINADLGLLRSVAAWAVKAWPQVALHRPDELIDNFKHTLMDEIDFTVEAKNQERLEQVFKDTPWVRIPKVYWEYTTKRLLVMEYLDGLKLPQQELFQEWGLDPKLLAKRLSDCMFRQIFELGLFHSDPHPGNILYMRGNQIGLVDFGIVVRFSDIMLDKFIDWTVAMINRDLDLFVRTFLALGTPLAPINRIQFRTDCLEYLDEVHFQPVGRISFAKVFEITNRIMYQHKIASPPNLLFFFKALSTLEGVTRRLNPEYDWRDDWGLRLRKIVLARYVPDEILSPEAFFKKYWKVWKDYDRLLLSEGPEDILEILKQVREGTLSIESKTSLPQLDKYIADIQKALHKLSVSLIVSLTIFGLFYLGRGRGVDFLDNLVESAPQYWMEVLFLILIILYFRKR